MEVLGRHSYRLSDGQKWNSRRLKRFPPNPVEWTEFSPLVTVQPHGGVGDAAVHEVVNVGTQEAEQGAEVEAALPGLIAAAPVEPWYPTCDRRAPDWFSTDVQLPQDRGRKKWCIHIDLQCVSVCYVNLL